jgi:hypothetical protein
MIGLWRQALKRDPYLPILLYLLVAEQSCCSVGHHSQPTYQYKLNPGGMENLQQLFESDAHEQPSV